MNEQELTISEGMEIDCDDDDAPHKAVYVIQLKKGRHIRTEAYDNLISGETNAHLLVTNATCPAQPVRLSRERDGDRYLRHRDVAHTHRIGERIGVAQ